MQHINNIYPALLLTFPATDYIYVRPTVSRSHPPDSKAGLERRRAAL